MIPAYDLELQRSHPQFSDLYMVIQQPERFTEGPYMEDREWLDWDWACQVNGAPTGDPVTQLTVNNGSGNATLLSGMTVLIGSTLGEWDKAIVRLRGDQNVNAGTVTLNIATSSDIAGIVEDDDWVVVLDEFRLWQIYGRIVADPVAETIDWYKDWNITWISMDPLPLGTDADRRIAMIPPVPIMGPHAVKFVDPPDDGAQFWFDWTDSYDPSVSAGGVVTSWTSWGETNHIGGTWNSVAQVPGWQTVNVISGLRGYRVVLEVDNGYGNTTTLPYRRGVRYVFTLRRPGQSQAHDPPNSEPITHFRLNTMPMGSFSQGYWRTSITVYEDEASRYNIMPGALVILFTDDWYMQNSPYLSPRGMRNESVGRIFDRENILMVGRIDGSTISINPETKDVSFDVLSICEEASLYQNYPIVINDNNSGTDWIDTPTLTVDRAIRYYTAWHTTLTLVADVYDTGDQHSIKAQDFLEGDIYSTLNSFLLDRLFARMLSDRFGRIFCEIDVQMQPYGSVETLWTLEDTDWLDEITAKRLERNRCKAAECGGIIYLGGDIIPKLSRAPGSFDGYRGTTEPNNALAIWEQDELNVLAGRYWKYMNYEWELGLDLAGHWRWPDIAPQAAVYISELDTERGIISNRRMIIREVSLRHELEAGCFFTSVVTQSEETDGKAGETVNIPQKIPPPPPPPWKPPPPWEPPIIGDGGEDSGRRIFSTDVGVFVTDDIGDVYPHWYAVNTGVPTARLRCYKILRDPWHWWTSGGAERTLWGMFTQTGGWYAGALGTGVPFYLYKHENFPVGVWELSYSSSELGGGLGHWQLTDMVGTIEVEDRWYLSVHQHTGGLDAGPLWCVRSDDGGDNWATQGAYAVGGADWVGYCGWYGNADARGINLVGRLAMANHGGGARLYGYYEQRPANVLRVMRSLNSGGVWAATGAPNGIGGGVEPIGGIAVPYVDAAWPDSDVVITSQVPTIAAGIQRSVDTATTWSDVSGAGANYRVVFGGVCPSDRLSMAYICNSTVGNASKVIRTSDGGVTWTTWKSMAYLCSAGGFIKWTGTAIDTILLFEKAPTSDRSVRLLTPTDDIDKTGDLFTAGAVTDVSRCERDSMGAA